METLLLILSVLALLVALAAWKRAGAQAQRASDLDDEIRRRARTVTEETDEKLNLVRKLLARIASGEKLTADMIREGRLWHDIATDKGQALLEAGPAFVLDVRTAAETSGGMLPNAVHIPVSELEDRVSELPRNGQPMLIYCASGGRSAAACEFLANEGFEGLHNLSGGIGGWRGAIERPGQ